MTAARESAIHADAVVSPDTRVREQAIHVDVVATGTTKAREATIFVDVVVGRAINAWAIGVIRVP